MALLPTPLPRGTETILLVEPEPETRALGSFMLNRLGYRVLEARSSADAIRLYEEQTEPVALLLAEALMSRGNGHDLAQRLQAQDPDLKVLFLADSDYRKLTRKVAQQRGLLFLERPFTMSILAATIRQALDAAPARRFAAGSQFA